MQDQLSLTRLQFNQGSNTNIKALARQTAAKTQFAPQAGEKNAAVLKSAKEFESSFLTTMLEQMWTGVEAEAPFGGGHAEEVYRSMIVGEYAKSISKSGGIGLADHVYREILSAQEGLK